MQPAFADTRDTVSIPFGSRVVSTLSASKIAPCLRAFTAASESVHMRSKGSLGGVRRAHHCRLCAEREVRREQDERCARVQHACASLRRQSMPPPQPQLASRRTVIYLLLSSCLASPSPFQGLWLLAAEKNPPTKKVLPNSLPLRPLLPLRHLVTPLVCHIVTSSPFNAPALSDREEMDGGALSNASVTEVGPCLHRDT